MPCGRRALNSQFPLETLRRAIVDGHCGQKLTITPAWKDNTLRNRSLGTSGQGGNLGFQQTELDALGRESRSGAAFPRVALCALALGLFEP